MEKLKLVTCPNRCFDGMVKRMDSERALFDFVKCPYCKGEGLVTKEKAKEIDALL